MTKADIDAWNLADAKLNEHIAISKVDTDAVLDLRMKELETQRRFLNGDKTTDYAGEMNFADAKRYNQYWDELEKGSTYRSSWTDTGGYRRVEISGY